MFDSADILRNEDYQPNTSGQRRKLIEQYYSTVDLSSPNDVRKLLDAFELVLIELEDEIDRNESGSTLSGGGGYSAELKTRLGSLCRFLQRDGFVYEQGAISPVSKTVEFGEFEKIIEPMDLPHLRQQIRRMQSAVETDPGLAIGTAKEIIETTCKTILDARGVEYDRGIKIHKLTKLVMGELKIDSRLDTG